MPGARVCLTHSSLVNVALLLRCLVLCPQRQLLPMMSSVRILLCRKPGVRGSLDGL
ncbi:hypothetical protein PISMIDRAFT_671291, partial [Pisolithus microcarpus 441]